MFLGGGGGGQASSSFDEPNACSPPTLSRPPGKT